MKICVDFDGTVVEENGEFYSGGGPEKFEFIPFAQQALRALHRAGHFLILSSCRANREKRFGPEIFIDDTIPTDWRVVEKRLELCTIHQRRFEGMRQFIRSNLPGVFDVIDEGTLGKPIADLYFDNRAFLVRGAREWERVGNLYGHRMVA